MQPTSPDHRVATTPAATRSRRSFIPRDCQVARFSRTNLLLIGSPAQTEDVVEALWPTDATQTWRPGQTLRLPTSDSGVPGDADMQTLILHEIGQLSREDQACLSQWLESQQGRVHVVSTSAAPLHLRVAAGAFVDSLYYRLNTVCVELDD